MLNKKLIGVDFTPIFFCLKNKHIFIKIALKVLT